MLWWGEIVHDPLVASEMQRQIRFDARVQPWTKDTQLLNLMPRSLGESPLDPGTTLAMESGLRA